MSKRHTLIENIKLDEHTYLVTIGTEIGQFTGTVKCREEDWDYESEYFGFELAELKAEIKYASAKKKYFNAQLKALTQFFRDMVDTRTYDVDAFWVKKIRERINAAEGMYNFWASEIDYLKTAYFTKIGTFDALNKKRSRREKYNNG